MAALQWYLYSDVSHRDQLTTSIRIVELLADSALSLIHRVPLPSVSGDTPLLPCTDTGGFGESKCHSGSPVRYLCVLVSRSMQLNLYIFLQP